jgi:hypothetical protein
LPVVGTPNFQIFLAYFLQVAGWFLVSIAGFIIMLQQQ